MEPGYCYFHQLPVKECFDKHYPTASREIEYDLSTLSSFVLEVLFIGTVNELERISSNSDRAEKLINLMYCIEKEQGIRPEG